MDIARKDIVFESFDNFELGAYTAEPTKGCQGAVVVIQEIFGVNAHIREVADGYAEAGYFVLAPKIFDRISPNIELGYEEADMGRGIELAFQQLDLQTTLKDIQAAINLASERGKVGVVGYCFGGLLTWLSACNLQGVNAASSYYGGGIVDHLNGAPKCPLMMHFGELDGHIPMADVDQIKAFVTDVPVHVYPADHGFNCDHRGSYNAESAALARSRTLALFEECLAAR